MIYRTLWGWDEFQLEAQSLGCSPPTTIMFGNLEKQWHLKKNLHNTKNTIKKYLFYIILFQNFPIWNPWSPIKKFCESVITFKKIFQIPIQFTFWNTFQLYSKHWYYLKVLPFGFWQRFCSFLNNVRAWTLKDLKTVVDDISLFKILNNIFVYRERGSSVLRCCCG